MAKKSKVDRCLERLGGYISGRDWEFVQKVRELCEEGKLEATHHYECEEAFHFQDLKPFTEVRAFSGDSSWEVHVGRIAHFRFCIHRGVLANDYAIYTVEKVPARLIMPYIKEEFTDMAYRLEEKEEYMRRESRRRVIYQELLDGER